MTEKPAPPAPGETSLSAYEVRPVTAADMPQMQRLFKAVFNQEMSEALFSWKYRSGSSAAMGVFRDGELLAHYGGIGADIVIAGEPSRAIQVVDVMVSPQVRTGVRSQSPFYLAASTFLEQYIGYGRPYLLGYGFPNNRTMQLAEHLKLYAPVGSISELTMPLDTRPRLEDSRWKWAELTSSNHARHAGAIAALWQRMQDSLPDAILVRRDAERIAWRYLKHPHHQYHVWMLQSLVLGRASALVVLKREADHVRLMDAIAPLEIFPDLLRLTAVQAARRFNLPLKAWFSTSHVDSVVTAGAVVEPLPIAIPANIWSEGPAPAELQDRWWLTVGDTDFL